ncbi:hypothetical protein NPIL_685971 [Nephila pilipes]|uniref:Uncharacterized protein n=1 Tax=Nephila pilipes TaxID=299642 RepID=A0A8X6UMX3_NEPPI|nr:hypothetical protein NPIL_685971 [Nephila pilipes]
MFSPNALWKQKIVASLCEGSSARAPEKSLFCSGDLVYPWSAVSYNVCLKNNSTKSITINERISLMLSLGVVSKRDS